MNPTAADARELEDAVLAACRAVFSSWQGLRHDDVAFDAPKGFSSFTMGVRPQVAVDPPAVLFRKLEGKDNAILDFDTEREVFLLLGAEGIAAPCLHYDDQCRIEAFYHGRTLTAADVFDPDIQRGVANQLYRFHQLEPAQLPERTFFELLHRQWGAIARHVLWDRRDRFPADEQALCLELQAIVDDAVHERVLRCLPDRPPVFCHNDTYHGNVMQLDSGEIKLLDFEFSCRNHAAFDVANFFAETVMVHGLADPPHFRIDSPAFTDADLARFIGFYLDNDAGTSGPARQAEAARLLDETRTCLLLSDYMYAMAALPLALEPIQKIRFIPYAHQRFTKFMNDCDARFG